MNEQTAWCVLLLGGASGVGKTRVSYRLAHHYGVGLTEVDDFQIVLEHVTTPEDQPVVHYFRTHRQEALSLDDAGWLRHLQAYGRVMEGVLEPVVANHLETRTPTILEGDFLMPSLAVRARYGGIPAGGRVRAVFLFEEDEAQIAENYRLREGVEQSLRAHVSWCQSQWLRKEAESLGLLIVPARPWGTVLERVVAAVGAWPEARI